MKDNLLGYKICYIEKGHRKLNRHYATNSHYLANFIKQDAEKSIIYSRYRRYHKLKNPTWYILPILKKKEYRHIWKGCPF